MLTTDSVPEQQKVTYWNEVVSRTLVPMAVSPRGTGPFDGRITTRRLGYLQVSTVEADAKSVSRTPALITPSCEALVAVAVQMSGTATFAQGGRTTEVGEGDLVVYETGRPYSIDYPRRFTTHVFQLPRHTLPVSDSDLRRIAGDAIRTSGGVGGMLCLFLSALASLSGARPPVIAHRLAGDFVDLLSTLIAERTRPDGARPDTASGALLLRVREHIDRNLGDPDLSPESIARAHGMSVRYLHKLFEGEGTTVCRLVQRRRLEECSRELAHRGRATASVSAVAHRWGFSSPAHFSRIFRAAYGVPPREWRALHTARDPLSPVPAGPSTTASTTTADGLRDVSRTEGRRAGVRGR
ncbi:helix-turn-helix domain-containing protein [Streptomyces sp. SMC 277]|uniref:Helix-turn-helix domain-containing protein n=1 Tax=Streptomyces antimicrobicus TaxID=2883108 RepID=A0ABS8B470_9ACTN|nr:helix-turn-helix domain-containing protein [Streptomyces antimicrobicus]MCB5179399.1 helix-turn-helix domain-containing protein [Streptomyces antimicrobicus]